MYQTYIRGLERVQVRLVKHLDYRMRAVYTDYSDAVDRHNMESLESRRVLLDMSFLYNIVHGRIDSRYLCERMAVRVPDLRRTRQNYLFYIPILRTNYLKNSVVYRMLDIYNKRFNHIDIFLLSRAQFIRAVSETAG